MEILKGFMQEATVKTAARYKLRKMILAVMAVACFISLPAQAEERKHKIEAAYLYSFFNYITWPGYNSPQELREPLICIYGEDEIFPYVEYIRNKASMERKLIVRVVNQKEEANDCNILFIRHYIAARWVNSIPNSVLTVTEPDDPLDRGGMVELSQEGERITIKIDQQQLENNGFAVSSRLLNLTK